MIIYKITNIRNGKIYIGQSSRGGGARWRDHLRQARTAKPIQVVDKAIKKYGKQCFRFDVIETVSASTSMRALGERERFFINKFKSFDPSKGYNMSLGGDRNNAGYKRSSKTRLTDGNHTAVAVSQYSLDGRHLESFPSMAEAGRKTGVSVANICGVLKGGRRKTAGGFQWRQASRSRSPTIPALKAAKARNRRRVYCFTKKGRLHGVFDSITSAAKATKSPRTGISIALDSASKSAGGFIWSSRESLTQKQIRLANRPRGKTAPKPVTAFDRNGRPIMKFKSQAEAARITGTLKNNVWLSCTNEEREVKTSEMGFCRFRYSSSKVVRLKAKLHSPRSRPKRVAAYDASGIQVGLYTSITDAAKQTSITRATICCAISGRQKSAGGCRWILDTDERPAPAKLQPLSVLVVCQYDFHGKLIATYKDSMAAAKHIGCSFGTISSASRGITYSACGFYWRRFPKNSIPKRIKTPPPLRQNKRSKR